MKLNSTHLLMMTLMLIACSSAFAKEKNATKVLEKLNTLNQPRTSCARSPASLASPTPNPLLTERLTIMSDKLGVSAETDWKWLNLLQKLYLPSNHTEATYLESIKNNPNKKNDFYIRTGNCQLHLQATLTTGLDKNNKEVVMLGSVSNLKVVSNDDQCNCNQDKVNCTLVPWGTLNPTMACRKVISQYSANPPMTKSTFTSDFLSDLHSIKRQAEIIDKCQPR